MKKPAFSTVSAHITDPDEGYDMYFGNPVFEPGKTQSTCRLGDKWEKRLNPGDVINIKATADGGNPEKGKAQADADVGLVVGVGYAPFDRLSEGWIVKYHDPGCRTRDGLAEEMRAVYGEDFARDSHCTMVLFTPHKLEQPTQNA